MLRTRFRALSKMHLVFDFDGTITTADTIAHLATAAMAAQERRRGARLQPAWDALVQAYLGDLAAYTARFRPREAARTTPAQEALFLAGLRDVERASLRRVGEAALFQGLAAADLRRIGADAVRDGHVTLRQGFGALVRAARDHGWPVSVVSVNWSAAFIRGATTGLLREEDAVVANSAREDDGVLQGPDALGGELLVCAPDKARAMQRVHAGAGSGKLLYFGDATTDLTCLLEADAGVVLADGESALRTALKRLGVEVPHVSDAKGRIVWARSFDEVLESGFLRE